MFFFCSDSICYICYKCTTKRKLRKVAKFFKSILEILQKRKLFSYENTGERERELEKKKTIACGNFSQTRIKINTILALDTNKKKSRFIDSIRKL